MSTFVYASDLHGNVEAYERLFALPADAVVLGGDLLPFPREGDLIEVQRRFARDVLAPLLDSRPCFWIPGNDDWEGALGPLEGRGTCIHRKAVPFLDGHSIAGYACVPLTPFGMKDFDRYDGSGWEPAIVPKKCLLSGPGGPERVDLMRLRARGSIEADLERLATLSDPAKTVYVVHTPPHGTPLDRLHDGTPIGSPSLRRFLERRRPPLSLHGHVHESPGIVRLGDTLSVNPGDSLRELRAVRVDLAELDARRID
jgi:Icc-related predicted phosphoesterase